MSFTLIGVIAYQQRLIVESNKLVANVYKALRQEGDDILKDSIQNYVPEDTRALKNTGKVEGPDAQGEVTISFSGPNALSIHEHPGNFDPPTWIGKTITFTVGGPKYLERPMRIASTGMARRIAAKVKV